MGGSSGGDPVDKAAAKDLTIHNARVGLPVPRHVEQADAEERESETVLAVWQDH